MKNLRKKIQCSSILILVIFSSPIFYNVSALELKEFNIKLINGSESPVDMMMNNPPNPPIITGPISGKIKEYYTYNFTITDPDGDIMFNLEIDWGDGTESVDCGCDKSWQNGTVVSVSHRWDKQESYGITARVSDSYGLYSNWSEPLVVKMPKQINIHPFYRYLSFFSLFLF